MEIQLGQRVKDRMTNLTGIAVSRTKYLYGCVRIGIQPEETKDGRPVEQVYLDEPQLEVLADVHVPGLTPAYTHGDRPAVPRGPDPR